MTRKDFFGQVVSRPLARLRSKSEAYSQVWKVIDQARSHRSDLGECPSWCFLPMRVLSSILSSDPQVERAMLKLGHAETVGLAAWRTTQGVYLFDQDTLDALWSTSIKGEIPVAVLEALPEWCCYVAFPKPRKVFGEMGATGFFVWLNYDPPTGRRELCFLMEEDKPLNERSYFGWWALVLAGTIEESIRSSLKQIEATQKRFDEARKRMEAGGQHGADMWLQSPRSNIRIPEMSKERSTFLVDHYWEIVPLVSLTLYLCSAEPDVAGREKFEPPYHPKPTRTRDGQKLFPPNAPQVWEVGYRIGATLRLTKEQFSQTNEHSGGSGDGTHVSPRPHLRQAHWHTFWTGPRTAPQQPRVRWLNPILVNDDGRLIPTVHRVVQ